MVSTTLAGFYDTVHVYLSIKNIKKAFFIYLIFKIKNLKKDLRNLDCWKKELSIFKK